MKPVLGLLDGCGPDGLVFRAKARLPRKGGSGRALVQADLIPAEHRK